MRDIKTGTLAMQIFNSHDPPGGCTPVNARRTSLPSKTSLDEQFGFRWRRAARATGIEADELFCHQVLYLVHFC